MMIEIERGSAGCPGLARLEPSDAVAVAASSARLRGVAVPALLQPDLEAGSIHLLLSRSVDQLDVALAAVEDGEIVGIAQYSRRPGADKAELAILVADGWQRQGLGTRMIAALSQTAMSHDVKAFAVDVQGDNYGAHRLLRRVAPGLRLAFSSGVGEGSFPIASSR